VSKVEYSWIFWKELLFSFLSSLNFLLGEILTLLTNNIIGIIRAALKEFIIKKNYKPTDITMLSYGTNKILEAAHWTNLSPKLTIYF
jgi:2-hydroxy-3-keto-5-methylthiopentenyl-1-phosphate phosphatase